MRLSGWLRFRAGSWALCPLLSWLLLRALCVYKSLRFSPLAKEGLIKEEVHLALAQRSLKPPKTWGDAGSRIPGAHWGLCRVARSPVSQDAAVAGRGALEPMSQERAVRVPEL